MSTASKILLVAVLAASGALLFGSSAQAGTLDAVLPQVGKPAPFDLTYVPPEGGQGIMAFRPAAIARLIPPLSGMDPTHQLLKLYLGLMVDINLDAAEPPALADLDQFVAMFSMVVTAPANGAKGSFMMGAGGPMCLRTVRPFDWAGRLAKWFPHARHEQHAGKEYLTVPFKFAMGPMGPSQVALYVADDRTLVCSIEMENGGFRTMLERLQAGKPGITPPPGWDEINRSLIAVVLDARTQAWFKGQWPQETEEQQHGWTLVENLQVVAVGLSMGNHPGVKVVATARNEAALGQVTAALEPLRGAAYKELLQSNHGLTKLLIALVDQIALEQEGATLRMDLGLPVDVISQCLSAMQKKQ